METEGDDNEDWMFRTFNPAKKNQENSEGNKTKRTGLVEQYKGSGFSRGGIDILENGLESEQDEVEDSPFDLAPDLNKQFHKITGQIPESDNKKKEKVCEDLNCYMDNLDDLIESQFRM